MVVGILASEYWLLVYWLPNKELLGYWLWDLGCWDIGFLIRVVGVLDSEHGLLVYWLQNKSCWDL